MYRSKRSLDIIHHANVEFDTSNLADLVIDIMTNLIPEGLVNSDGDKVEIPEYSDVLYYIESTYSTDKELS